jgi:hypothetical protein
MEMGTPLKIPYETCCILGMSRTQTDHARRNLVKHSPSLGHVHLVVERQLLLFGIQVRLNAFAF